MRANQKKSFISRKVAEMRMQLGNSKMSSAAPSVQSQFQRLQRHWDTQLSNVTAVQERRQERRDKARADRERSEADKARDKS